MSGALRDNQLPSRSSTESLQVEAVLESFSDAHYLTPREKQVFLQVCTGKKNISVAMDMGLSEATIRLHITNLHRKLGTGNKVDLLLKAFKWRFKEQGSLSAELAAPDKRKRSAKKAAQRARD